MPDPTQVPPTVSREATPGPEEIRDTVAPPPSAAPTPLTRNTDDPWSQPPASELASRLDGRYELLGEVGRGGMGAVLRGRDRTLGRDLAIKVLLGQYAGRPEAVQRFHEEAQVGGQLQHPGVVPIYDLGRSADGQPYFTMKLVKGVTLASLLRLRPDPTRERPRFLGIVLQVCQAVGYAHSRGVIHRDLKPANVMVGAFGEVQVMDWGLAKVMVPSGAAAAEATVTTQETEPVAASVVKISRPDEGTATQAGDVLGTPAYMPPEQALGEIDQFDERCDVFSLGAILCEVLTGQPPYADRDGAAALRRARRGDLADALARLDGCGADPELTDLARRCLAADPAARPRNAGEMARAVEAYLAGVEERARRAEVERAAAQARAEEARATARAERRARKLTVGLAAAALLLVVAGGGGAWLMQQQHAAAVARRQQADEKARTAMVAARDLLQKGWDTNDREKLAAAEAEADKAVKVADSGGASEEVRQEAEELRRQAQARGMQAKKNAALLADLLNVTAPRETSQYVRGESGTMLALAEPSVEEQFKEVFLRWDPALDLDRTPLETLVVRLGDQPKAVVQEVVAGLDTWMLERRRRKGREDEWQRLFQLVEKLDRDEDNREVRRLLVSGALGREATVRVLARSLLPWSTVMEAPPGKQTQRLREQAAKAGRSRGPVLGLVTLARVLEGVGDPKGAERLLRAAVTAQPDREVLLDALGKLLERQGPVHREEAIACYRATRALRPLLGIALGKALLEAGRAAEAEGVFADLMARQPNNPSMPFHLGRALSVQKRYSEAEAACRRAIALQPNFAQAHGTLGNTLIAQKRYAEAEAACRKAIALQPDLAAAHIGLGNILCAQRKYAEAEAASRKAIALKPDFAEAHVNLGNALCFQKRLKEAEEACRKAITLQPDLAEAHVTLGFTLDAQKRYAEAEAACHKAIALQPDLAEAHVTLGLALIAQKRYAAGEAACRKGITLQPGSANTHYNLGRALDAQNRYAEAETAYRQAIALRPGFAEAHVNLGNALIAQKRYAEAEAACHKAIALQPDLAEAHVTLGFTLSAQNRYAEAETAYRQAIALWPDDAKSRYGLGNALGRQQKLGEAETAYRKCLEVAPDFPEAHCNLGHILRAQGRFAESLASLRRGHTLGSQRPGWPYPSARWVQQAQQSLDLDHKLTTILQGKAKPAGAAEQLSFAKLCAQPYKQRHATAARFYVEAFAAEPKRADDLGTQHRYNAACSAALAAAGKGKDAATLDAKERTRLRQQALTWLQADLTAYSRLADKAAARPLVHQRLAHWLEDTDLTGVRDAKALAALPEAERKEWRKLWADVATLLKKVADGTTS